MHSEMIPKNEGKREFAVLRLIGLGGSLQSIVSDKIKLPGPWEVSLVHHETLI